MKRGFRPGGRHQRGKAMQEQATTPGKQARKDPKTVAVAVATPGAHAERKATYVQSDEELVETMEYIHERQTAAISAVHGNRDVMGDLLTQRLHRRLFRKKTWPARPARAGEGHSGVSEEELDRHWNATIAAADAMTTREIIDAFRAWLDCAEEEYALERDLLPRRDLVVAWATLAFEDCSIWIHAGEGAAANADEQMHAALDRDSRLAIDLTDQTVRTGYALASGQGRRDGFHVDLRAGTDLDRFAAILWHSRWSRDDRESLPARMRSEFRLRLPRCARRLPDDDGYLLEIALLAHTVPVKGEHAKSGSAGEDNSKWGKMMKFATEVGVTKTDGSDFENPEAFRKMFQRSWVRLAGARRGT